MEKRIRGQVRLPARAPERNWPVSDWGITLACLAESGGSLRHLDVAVSQYNFTGSGVWSSLDSDAGDMLSRSSERTLRKLIPLRYKTKKIWMVLSGVRHYREPKAQGRET